MLFYITLYHHCNNEYVRFAVQANSEPEAKGRAMRSVGDNHEFRVEKCIDITNVNYSLEL